MLQPSPGHGLSYQIVEEPGQLPNHPPSELSFGAFGVERFEGLSMAQLGGMSTYELAKLKLRFKPNPERTDEVIPLLLRLARGGWGGMR